MEWMKRCFAWVSMLAGALICDGISQNSLQPPPGPVRAAAEFEPSKAVVVSWEFDLDPVARSVLNEGEAFMVKYIQDAGAKVYVIVPDAGNQAEIENYLASQSPPISTDNVQFLHYSSVPWTRDFGAQSVFYGPGNTPAWVDVNYDLGREYEEIFPEFFSSMLNTQLYSADTDPNNLKNHGGNFLTDGFGFGLSVESILTSHNQSASHVANMFQQYYGITNLHIITGLHWALEHVDLFMKFLDEETLMVGQYEGEFGEGVEIALQYIVNTFSSVWGKPFKIVRVPTPGHDAPPMSPYTLGHYYTYTNSLIVNDHVLVPLFGKPEDAGALEAYRKAMPGYKIVGHDFSGQIANDAVGLLHRAFIHCLTHEITREDTFIPSTKQLPIDMDVPDRVYSDFNTLVSRNSMRFDGNVEVASGGHVRAKSDGAIIMGPGFSVKSGAVFRAAITN